jgi:hypothetical protein
MEEFAGLNRVESQPLKARNLPQKIKKSRMISRRGAEAQRTQREENEKSLFPEFLILCSPL